jgi:ABC-2 type transport system permease protein
VRAALRAEWSKLTTVPDGAVALLLTIAVTVAAGAAARSGGPDPVRLGLIGTQLSQAVVAAAGVHLIAGEYGTGLIQPTFLALPRRGRVLTAKALLLLAGVVAATGPAVGAVLLLAGQPAWRPAIGTVLYLCLIALLGLGAGALLRNAAAATGLVLGLLYLAPALLRAISDPDRQDWLYRLSPSTAGQVVQVTVGQASLPIGPWAGLAVTAGWASALTAAGALVLCRRDA